MEYKNYIPGNEWPVTWPKSNLETNPPAEGQSVSASDWPSGIKRRHLRSCGLFSWKAGWNHRIYNLWHMTGTKLLPDQIQRSHILGRTWAHSTSQAHCHSNSASKFSEQHLDPHTSGFWELLWQQIFHFLKMTLKISEQQNKQAKNGLQLQSGWHGLS